MSRRRVAEEKLPVTVRSGPVRIRVCKEIAGDKVLYGARWTEAGVRKRFRKKSLAEAKTEARRVADRLAGGVPDLNDLTDDDIAVLQEIRRKGVTLADLEALQTVENVTVEVATSRLLKAKVETSMDNQRTLKTHLCQFGRTFGKRIISSITTTELDGWLMEVTDNARSRRNKRGAVVTLWRWSRDKGLLPQTLRTVAERTDSPSLRKQKRERVIETWSPAELRTILKAVPPAYLPWVVLSAFAGVRTLEIFSQEKGSADQRKQVLAWEDVVLTGREPRIVVPAAVSKTAEKRTIPISRELAAWLKTTAVRKGPICPLVVPWKGTKGGRGKSVTDLITGALDGPWKKNALRHSFATYRVLQVESIGKVALEMGNSERVIKSHYHDAGRKRAEARRWFELGPDKVSRKLEVVA